MQLASKKLIKSKNQGKMMITKLLNNKRGFTLLEVIVVIAVISILAGIGAVYANRYLPVYRLREATRDIVSTLQDARLEAVRRGGQCVVSFGANGFDYIAFVDTNRDFVFNGTDVQLEGKLLASYRYVFWGDDGAVVDGTGDGVADPLATAVNFANNNVGNPSIGFNNRGMSLNPIGGVGAGRIQLENTQSRVRQIIVNFAGNVRIQ